MSTVTSVGHRAWKYVLPALLVVMILSDPVVRPCFGQTFVANLSGIVTDPSGAVIPGAPVELKNTDTNDTRRTTTGADGSYTFPDLVPGTYELSVKAAGFKTFVQQSIMLFAGRSSGLDVKLEVGQPTQTVEVKAAGVLVDTESANESTSLNRTLVTELPTNTRTPLNLVFAFAGTVPAPGGMYSPDQTFDQMFNSFGLNGGRSMSTAILLDGAPATAADWGGLIVSPTVDSVQELQVTRNTYDAQYGRAGGSVINIVSKGGSNEFHGLVYDYFRNDNLDANSWVNNTASTPKPEFKRNQFGGNAGGPLWRSKRVYFFGAYEGLRQPFTGSSGFMTVPTALQRQGDFSQTYNGDGTLAVIYNPFTTDPNTLARQPFDATCVGVVFPNTCSGNKIPSTMFDTAGSKVANLYPMPNRPGEGPDQLNNFFAVGAGHNTNDKVEGRVDWAHNDKHRMFGRWSQRIRQEVQNPCFMCNGEDSAFNERDTGFQFTLDNTLTPSPTWVVSVLLGLSYWQEKHNPNDLGKDTSITGLPASIFQANIPPAFGVSGYSSLGATFGQNIQIFPRQTDSLQINITKEKGSHALKFGWTGEDDLVNNITRWSGTFDFGRGMTSGPMAATDSTTTGNGIASLLLGTAADGQSLFNADIAGGLRYYGTYFQDTWRVSPKLTLDLGLRYEIQPGGTERFNRLAVFNPAIDNPIGQQVGLPLKGGMQFASAGNRRAWQTDTKNFAPRIGLAYKATNKLVVRAGFGIFFLPTSDLWTFDSPGEHPGFSTSNTMIASAGNGGLIPTNLLSNPFPQGLTSPTGNSLGLLTFLGQSPFQTWPSGVHPTAYKQDWSLNFQYQLDPNAVLEVGYAGFGARKLSFGNPSLNANQLPTSLLSMGSALDDMVANPFAGVPQVAGTFLEGSTTGCPTGVNNCIARNRLLRPFPEFDSIQWTRSWPGATANFDALNVKFTRQFSSGLTLLSTYQWSKTMDDASEGSLGWALADQWRDYYNRKAEYSISAHDIPQSFVTSLVYQLPFGRGKRFGSNLPGAAEQVLGGWQVSSIVRFASGLPIFPILGSQPNGAYGYVFAYVNKVGDPGTGQRTTAHWFNTNAYQDDTQFTIGNAPRYDSRLREQGAKNVDFGLMKNFKAEAYRIQFRAEFLNAFNTPQFGGGGQWFSNIGNCIFCGNFGQVSGTRNLPRNVQLALKFEF